MEGVIRQWTRRPRPGSSWQRSHEPLRSRTTSGGLGLIGAGVIAAAAERLHVRRGVLRLVFYICSHFGPQRASRTRSDDTPTARKVASGVTFREMGRAGLEPATSGLSSRRSPS
jgi:hypothetical protein